MGLLIVAFIFMLLVTFGVLFFAMRPTQEEKALDKRISHLKTSPGQSAMDGSGLLLASQDEGSFSWIEVIASQLKLHERLRLLILQSESSMAVGKLLMYCGGSAVAGAAIADFFMNYVVALLVSVPASLLPVLFLQMKRSRKVEKFNDNLADSIDMMSRSLRAGHSVVASIGIIAEQASEPVRTEFNEVFKKQNYGLPIRDALTELLERVPSQDLRVLVTGMLVQKETGGNLAEILDRISFVIRERVRIQGEIQTHTAQGRLTGWILCALPVVMLVLINWVNPGYSKVLLDTPTGHKLLYAGVGLLVIGGLIIRQIINGIEV